MQQNQKGKNAYSKLSPGVEKTLLRSEGSHNFLPFFIREGNRLVCVCVCVCVCVRVCMCGEGKGQGVGDMNMEESFD